MSDDTHVEPTSEFNLDVTVHNLSVRDMMAFEATKTITAQVEWLIAHTNLTLEDFDTIDFTDLPNVVSEIMQRINARMKAPKQRGKRS